MNITKIMVGFHSKANSLTNFFAKNNFLSLIRNSGPLLSGGIDLEKHLYHINSEIKKNFETKNLNRTKMIQQESNYVPF